MKVSVRQRVYDYLWDRLVQGGFAPGEPVLAQDVCQALGVSHIPVREAMFQLCAEGLLERTPRRALVVSTPTRAEILQLWDIRTTLEARAAELAAEQITTVRLQDLNRLVDALGRLAAAAGSESTRTLMYQWALVDMMLHRVLIRASGNEEALKVVERGVIRMQGFTAPYPEGWPGLGEQLQADYQVHADIVAALAQHDSRKARKAMLAHAERGSRTLLDFFESSLRSRPSGPLPAVRCFPWLQAILQEIEEHSLVDTGRSDRERLPRDDRLQCLWRVEGPAKEPKRRAQPKKRKTRKQ
jgi:DNA-binding GntR family transcriptional regulator